MAQLEPVDISNLLLDGRLEIVGSVLMKDNPRDLDLILILTDDQWNLRYGNFDFFVADKISGYWNFRTVQWSNDCCQLSALLSKRLKFNVDLKIVPESHKTYGKV